MKKNWLGLILGVSVCAVVVFGVAYSSLSADDFYVIPSGNRNVKTDATNTAVGVDALKSNTTGSYNTATGASALRSNTTGFYNTASGYLALEFNTTGSYNTASGYGALGFSTAGGNNAAFGVYALWKGNGSHNTAIGPWALCNNTTGWDNVALGLNAGYNGNFYGEFTGTNNIYIGTDAYPASLDESNTIRIGSRNNPQTQTFIAGIAGRNIGSGAYVFVNGSGQLGVISSSRRYKEDIKDMGDASAGLMQLRPVKFHYKPEYANGDHTLQYGLIAEEVAQVYPDLVLRDPKTGQPQTVAYHLVNAMLLNEVQKQHRQILEQENRIKALEEQKKELAVLKEQVRELTALVAQNQEAALRLASFADQPHR